jgi:hypothetical protein
MSILDIEAGVVEDVINAAGVGLVAAGVALAMHQNECRTRLLHPVGEGM